MDDARYADWLNRVDAWEQTVAHGLTALLDRAERVAVEKLTGRKVSEKVARHYERGPADLVWVEHHDPMLLPAGSRRAWLAHHPEFKAGSLNLTPAAASARARLAWATRRANMGGTLAPAKPAGTAHAPKPRHHAPVAVSVPKPSAPAPAAPVLRSTSNLPASQRQHVSKLATQYGGTSTPAGLAAHNAFVDYAETNAKPGGNAAHLAHVTRGAIAAGHAAAAAHQTPQQAPAVTILPSPPSVPTVSAPTPPAVPQPAQRTPRLPATGNGVTLQAIGQLDGLGKSRDARSHHQRRQQWIAGDRGRQQFADTAARWVGDFGNMGQNTRYVPIKQAAQALSGSSRGSIRNPQDKAAARELMLAAAEAPTVPKMFRGLALSDTQLANLQPGQRFTEALGSWTTDPVIARGYGSLRTRGQLASGGNRNIVVYELSDGHGVNVSPLSASSVPAFFNGEEHLSSGLYEVESVGTSTEPLPWMDQNGASLARSPRSARFTVVKVRQVERGFDPDTPGQFVKSLAPLDELPGWNGSLNGGIDWEDLDWQSDPEWGTKAVGCWIGTKALDSADVFDVTVWIAQLAADAAVWLLSIMRAFASDLWRWAFPGEQSPAPGVGGSFDVVRQRWEAAASSAAQAQARRLASSLETIADQLADQLAAGEALRESPSEIADRVHEVFAQAKTTNVKRVAATEVPSAANAGAFLAAVELANAGIDIDKTWWTKHDDRVRPAHRLVHETTVGLFEHFTVGGFPMLFPGDPTAPLSLVVNCRCWCVYAPVSDRWAATVRPSRGRLSSAVTLAER